MPHNRSRTEIRSWCNSSMRHNNHERLKLTEPVAEQPVGDFVHLMDDVKLDASFRIRNAYLFCNSQLFISDWNLIASCISVQYLFPHFQV